ncbi:MAG: metallophosphoesterase [Elusimicrobia bacterium]|nr:metallophosphoesterase [Elusimicrobiota bacterium]
MPTRSFRTAWLGLAFLLLGAFPARAQEPSCTRCIVVYGDTRSDHEAHRRVVSQLMKFKPAVVFHTGDMVSRGSSAKDWRYFNEISSGLRASAEFFPVHGNHEDHAPLYYQNFNLEPDRIWYSLDRSGVHFVVLDSESPLWEGSSQGKWLEDDLSLAAARFTVVLLHRPVYGTGQHAVHDTKILAPILAPLFKKYGVGAVFSGHDHIYERSEVGGIAYIVTGGGGAPLYTKRSGASPYSKVFIPKHNFVTLSVKPEGLFCEVFDDNGAPLDSFTVQPRAPRK